MEITPLTQSFIHHFGEMGSRWGINRTVGQMYALLFVAREPLCADDIAEALAISRSNVSMGLKELQSWQLVRLRHFAGDRREFFEAPQDIWEIFHTLAEQRRRREVEPTQSMLRVALMQTPASEDEAYAQQRMKEMHDLIEQLMNWFDEVQKLSPDTARQLLDMGAKVSRVLEFKDRLTGKAPKATRSKPASPRSTG